MSVNIPPRRKGSVFGRISVEDREIRECQYLAAVRRTREQVVEGFRCAEFVFLIIIYFPLFVKLSCFSS